ncbi:AsmA-like C-terminal region-containing protein [Salinihabitans flavidus]|nr:AsmA-like C-terminal region-containing protein [Salinihabitans flavidus]
MISHQQLQSALAEYAEDWTRGELHLLQDVEVTLNRGLKMTMANSVITGSTGGVAWRIEVASLSASLRTWPLLRGRIEIAQLVLDRPRIVIDDRDAAPPDLPLMARELATPVGEVIVTNASVAHQGTDEIRGLDLRLAAVPDSSSVLLTGALPAGERQIRIKARIDDPAAVFSERGSKARLALRGANAAENDGSLPPRPQPDISPVEGKSEVMRALRQVAMVTGLPGAGPVTLEGRFTAAPRSFEVADASMSVGGILVAGDLAATLTGEEPPLAQLNRVARGAQSAWRDTAVAIGSGAWREISTSIDWLAPLDIEMSAHLRDDGFGKPEIEVTRIRLETRGTDVHFDISSAGDLGRIEAGMTLGPHPRGGADTLRIATKGRLEEVDVGDVGRYILTFVPPPLASPPQLPEGMLQSEFELTAHGETLGGMLATLEGTVEAEARDGSLVGADLILTLEAVAQGRDFMTEQDGPLVPAAGRTMFDTLEGRIHVDAGRARLTGARIIGERYAINIGGEADLLIGELWAEGKATLYSDAPGSDASVPSVGLPFGLGGTLAAPVFAAGVPMREAEAEVEPTAAPAPSE